MNSTRKRHVAIWGGLLAGLGLGSCLAWSLNIFEIANPKMGATCSSTSSCDNMQLASLYPSTSLTVFAVLVFSGAFGLGLGLVASALIRDEHVPEVAVASATNAVDVLGTAL